MPANVARQIMTRSPVFIDTETTGLGKRDQVVEIAIVDTDGTVLLNTLVKPTIPIGEGAARVHGITAEEVAGAPTFLEILPDLGRVLAGRVVLAYNLDFDLRMLRQSAHAHGVALADHVQPEDALCAMRLYAAFWGEWDEGRGSHHWQALAEAGQQQGIMLPDSLHRARGDAEMTRQLVCIMSGAASREEP